MMRWPFAVVVLLVLTNMLHADQVVLTNGDRLSGSIIASEPDGLRLKSDLLGEIHVKWKAIGNLTTDQPLYLTLKDGRVVSGAIALSGENVELRTAPERVIRVPLDQVKAVRSAQEQASFEHLQNPGWFELWAGSVGVGLSAAQGNTSILTFTLDGKAARVTRRDKTSLYFTSLFNRDSSSGQSMTTANAVRSGIRYERNLRKRLFGFGFTDFETDALQDLDLRNVLGGGLGWRIKESVRTRFDVFSGGSLNQEFFSTGLDRRTGEILVGEELNRKLSSRSVITERLAVFPNLSDLGNYRVSFDASANTKLNHWLSWQFSVSDRLLSNPVPGAKKNDVLLTTGLNLTFGKENAFQSAFQFVELLKTPQK